MADATERCSVDLVLLLLLHVGEVFYLFHFQSYSYGLVVYYLYAHIFEYVE